MKKRIYCFGDSNTYGYDARSFWGERLPETERWPDILGALSGWDVINAGMNGREIPHEPRTLTSFDRDWSGCGKVDRMLILLGSNDLLNSYVPQMETIGERMERFVTHALAHPLAEKNAGKFLLIAPPRVDDGRFREEDGCYDAESGKFGSCYEKIASRYGLGFADAGRWELPLAHDGVHLTGEGHKRMARRLWEMLEGETPGVQKKGEESLQALESV